MLDPFQGAWAEHMAVQEAETRGSLGRKTNALINRARRLSQSGFHAQAMPLFMEAAALHAENATDACAASAFHALAVAIDDRAGCGRRTSNHEADKWFRRARASTARNRSSLRRGVTLYSHAACLRRLAHDTGPVDKKSLVDEAEACLREAADALQSLGPLALADWAAAAFNLANLLSDERRDFVAAEHAYANALQMAEMALDLVAHSPKLGEVLGTTAARIRRDSLPRIVAMLAKRRSAQALAEAKRIAHRHIEDADLELADEMVCVLAELLLSTTRKNDVQEARRVLRRRRPDQTAQTFASHAIRRATLLKRAGLKAEAMAFLDDAVRAAWHRRETAITDNDSDHVTAEAQAIGYLLADMQLDKGDAVAAFLTLENNAGLRFNDNHISGGYRPGTPQARYLYEKWLAIAELNPWLVQILEAARCGTDELLAQFLDGVETHKPSELTKGMTATAGQALVELLHQVPRTCAAAQVFIEGKISEVSTSMPRALNALLLRDEAARSLWSVQQSLNSDELAVILAQHPDTVALRLLGEGDRLVAVCAWTEGGKLCIRSARTPVPANTRNALLSANDARDCTDLRRMDEAARAIDIGVALPDRQIRRLVVLPSGWAWHLPVAALSSRKATLVDVADAIVQLPNLAPLRQCRHRDPKRHGEVAVIGPQVAVGDLVFGAHPVAGPILSGASANWREVRLSAQAARITTLIAHGEHPPYEHPVLRLEGEDRLLPDGAWKGTERVELWACTSGLSMPHDIFATHADEGFGLDYAFVHIGVHSAIGAQWPVSELATVMIARHHRSQLATGADAPTALVLAQRWWRTAAVPAIVSAVKADPDRGLVRAIEKLLGVPVSADLAALLGPNNDSEQAANAIERLRSCWSWAGFRFVGWDQGVDVPSVELPGKDECAAIDADLARQTAEPQRLADAIDVEIARRFSAVRQGGVEAAEARVVALLFCMRWRDATESNLIRGLAWLHEALARPADNDRDDEPLRMLGAWLWLDVAASEAPVPADVPAPVPLRRCDELLAMTFGRCTGLKSLVQARRQWQSLPMVKAVEGLADLADDMMAILADEVAEPEDVELLTLATAWLSLRVAVWPPIVEPRRDRLVGLLDAWLQVLSRKSLGGYAIAETAQVARLALMGVEPAGAIPDAPAWVLAAWLQAVANATGQASGGAPYDMTRNVSAILGDIEAAVTGYASDAPGNWWRGLAVPGEACRFTAGAYLEAHRAQLGDVTHVLACLQQQSDLMPMWCGALTRMFASVHGYDDNVARLFSDFRRLRHIDDTLRSAALVGHPESDGFQLDGPTLMQRLVETGDRTAWVLAGTTAPAEPLRETRTAAFAAVRHRHELGAAIAARCGPLATALATRPEGYEIAKQWLRPLVTLEDQQAGFRSLQPGYGYIGVFSGAKGTIGFVAAWNAGEGLRQSTVSAEAAAVLGHLVQLLAPNQAGVDRGVAFSELNTALRDPLGELLGAALAGPKLHWNVFAPGPARSLPWLGLHAGSQRIGDGVASWSHVASISMGAPLGPNGRPRVASLLTREPPEGSTAFTARVEETLRRWRPVDLCVERAAPNGRNVDEVLLIEPQAPTIDLFRVCSVGSPQAVNAVTAGFLLDRSRTFSVFNLIDTTWASGARVELWSDHHCLDDMMLALGRGPDRLPGLVGPLLGGGAQSVLDLAWPIHDLVKALVLEQYAWQGGGVVALRGAVESVRTMLKAWSDHAVHASNLSEAITLLEAGRAMRAEELRVPPVALARFSVASGEVVVFVRDVLDPVHLAAFRWWGMP